MTVARAVADMLTDHTVFEVEGIDRMYLNVYVPGLQYAAGLVAYVHRQLDLKIASTAPLGRITVGMTGGASRVPAPGAGRRMPFVEAGAITRKE